MHERRERPPNQKFGERPRRVERAGCLAPPDPLEGERAVAAASWFRCIVEDAFVHTAQLFDTEIGVRNTLPSLTGGSGRQRQHRTADGAIVQNDRIGERSMKRREELAVERRDPQRPCPTPAMRQPGDRLQRLPQPWRVVLALTWVPQRLNRVAVAIDGVPHRHQSTSLREQEEQDAIDDDERFVKERGGAESPLAAGGSERAQERDERLVHTLL